ncbi:emp24/gp25L/p24 family/GOLD domain containing protein [Amanita muscaria]
MLPFLAAFLPLITLLLFPTLVVAVKFSLPASRYPAVKCIWNTAHTNTLVIATANVGPGNNQRVDIEIIDSSPQRNVYLSKKGINGEARLAVTTHEEGEVGVCFRNYIEGDVPYETRLALKRTIDLDVDIGADAVDYNAIANQESLSTLETEMRKLEGLVKEVADELSYLKRREERFTDTNLSTNLRVQNFAWFTLFCLAGLGVWQIFHLRAYFKRKYLID